MDTSTWSSGVEYCIDWGGAEFGGWWIVLVGEINFSPRPRPPFFSAARKSGESWSCQMQMCRIWTWNSSTLEGRDCKQREAKK